MTEYSSTVLLDGLRLSEGPRWHDGKLWFSDMLARRVMTVDEAGSAETIVEVPGRPSGLGWLPDGTLLIVSMRDRKLLRLEGDRLAEVADLSPVATADTNDMVVDAAGRAYVGNFGADLLNDEPRAAALALVTPDGAVRAAAEGLEFPNGTVITPDGATLIIAESRGRRLTAFDVDGRRAPSPAVASSPTSARSCPTASASTPTAPSGSATPARPRSCACSTAARSPTVRVAAEGLEFPNGTVITPDGATLIVAESRGGRLTAFDVAADGSLSGRRVFAELGEVVPDGICLDADGAVWVSNPRAPEVVRVLDGGAVTDRVRTAHNSYACMLGGAGGRTLFICSADGTEQDRVAGRSMAYIEVVEVAVPHAGLP